MQTGITIWDCCSCTGSAENLPALAAKKLLSHFFFPIFFLYPDVNLQTVAKDTE